MLKEETMTDFSALNSPKRILSLTKERATVSFPDSDDKVSGFAISEEHGPKPSEVYGFVGSISTVVTTGIFLVWAYVPEPWLHSVGITYYPSRSWNGMHLFMNINVGFVRTFRTLGLDANAEDEEFDPVDDNYSEKDSDEDVDTSVLNVVWGIGSAALLWCDLVVSNVGMLPFGSSDDVVFSRRAFNVFGPQWKGDELVGLLIFVGAELMVEVCLRTLETISGGYSLVYGKGWEWAGVMLRRYYSNPVQLRSLELCPVLSPVQFLVGSCGHVSSRCLDSSLNRFAKRAIIRHTATTGIDAGSYRARFV
ncbi:hypothetical protein HHK36_031847 [Tetracentron sinense]|uniref:PIG-P domain-containing protein n=1 Tax=Tetracentron sinense TaxID=13715 RepID=A0A834Y8A7_TETSI|nr:hypothetical protein HHK36_031847 [Tetracentron sinense]